MTCDLKIHNFTNMVEFEDKGLTVIPLITEWGVTLKFKRQGRTLPWRVTMNHAGQCSIYKPATETLPRVELSGQYEEMQMMMVNFIQGGWI